MISTKQLSNVEKRFDFPETARIQAIGFEVQREVIRVFGTG
jgi:hypothetical protein